MTDYIDKFSHLRCDRVDGRPRPHKAVMLLSVTVLAEAGELTENVIRFDHRLLDVYRSLFALVRRGSDQPNPHNPFFHLKSAGFWHLHPVLGVDEALKHTRQVKGPGQINELIDHVSLDPALHLLLLDTARRHDLQAVLIQTYLHHAADPVWHMLKEEMLIHAHQRKLLGKAEQDIPVTDRVRSTAFRRMIRQLYDVRCAACGVRFFFDNVDLIDAAHLVPFSESGDDRPQNGIALCKNHHWLMDHAILAPGPGRGGRYDRPVWHVRSGLDDRYEEHRTVLELKGRTVITPQERQFIPHREGLDWRMAQLASGTVEAEMDYAE